MNKEEALLKSCHGVRVEHTTRSHSRGTYVDTAFYLDGNFSVPNNVFIEILMSATKGTIGRLVDIDLGDNSYRLNNQIYTHDITYILQVDGHNGTNRIARYHGKILETHDGTTKYVRNIKKHINDEIPPHINKYNQHLIKDVWVAGIGVRKTLFFGQVTRWSKSSVWVNPTPSIPKSKENCITIPFETLVMPSGIDYEQTVTMMVLSGWRR